MPASASEVVVVFGADADPKWRVRAENQSREGVFENIRLRPLFSNATTARARTSGMPEAVNLLSEQKRRFLSSEIVDRTVDSAINQLSSLPGVEAVYWKPGVENPIAPESDIPEPMVDVPGIRPTDFRVLQGYLDKAPGGIDVQQAWAKPGGKGAGIQVIDIEGGWRFTHSDLLGNSGGLLAGSQYDDTHWSDHGTAVLGQVGGDEDPHGVCGIAPHALLSAVSHKGLGSAKAIETAASRLKPGDVLLLEMHRPGPRHAFKVHPQQKGYIAVEWWPDDLLAIRSAVARGIVVVEAAGNGAEDLDDPLYAMAAAGFPPGWKNPFGGAVDSGAIVVGAGAPPNGVHGPDRSRLDFSNWGKRVDCQGWGRSVVTTGYGDHYSDPDVPQDQDYWYTRAFSGTSSASPIVTGAVACLQGLAKAKGMRIAPDNMREALRTTGSPQQGSNSAPVSQRIGRRPDLRALMQSLGL